MLWLISSLYVQILLALWVILMLYAALATIYTPMRHLLKVAVIPFIFLVAYTSIMTTEYVLGTPSFTDDEIQGKLSGYTVFEFNDSKHIAILLMTKDGPFTFAIPYNPSDEKNLSQAMQKMIKTGVPTIVHKKGDGQMGEGNGDGKDGKNAKSGMNGRQDGTNSDSLEFYDFTDQFLVPKESEPQ